MTWDELKKKYGIHVVKNESPNIPKGGALIREGIECYRHFSVWSDGKITAGYGFHVSWATWTIVQEYYWCKWEPAYMRITLYTQMTDPDLIDAFLEKAPRRGVNQYARPISEGWWGDFKK